MKKAYEKQASVTVFLVLIFTLIFSLVLVSLEAAKSAADRATVRLLLDAASESEMGRYYRPLFDKYHLYAMNLGYGNRKANIGMLENSLKERMQQNSSGMSVENVTVTDTIPYLSDGGIYFVNQAEQYEKLAVSGNLIASLLEKIGILGERAEVETVLARKMEVEEQLAILDRYTLQLMKLIDGVNIDPERIISSGKVYSIENSFVKKMFALPVNMINTGVNNDVIFSTLKSRYVNPLRHLELIGSFNRQYQDMIILKEDAKRTLDELNIEIEVLKQEICGLEEDHSPNGSKNSEREKSNAVSESDLERRKTLEEKEQELGELIQEAENMLESFCMLTEKASDLLTQLSDTAGSLSKLCSDTVNNMENALSVIAEADALREKLVPAVKDYENLVQGKREFLDPDEYEELNDGLEVMKQYVGLKSGTSKSFGNPGNMLEITDFSEAKSTLLNNLEVLNSSGFSSLCENIGALSSWEIEKRVSSIMSLSESFESLSYRGLSFDYSSINAKSAAETGVEMYKAVISDTLSKGLLNLLLFGEGNLSEARIETGFLPKLSDEMMPSDNAEPGEICVNPEELFTVGNGSEVLSDDSELSLFGSLLGHGFASLEKTLMTTAYVHDEFSSYSDTKPENGSVLHYEQEYILCGNPSDEANLAGAATRILLLRLPIAFIYSLTDRTMTEEAKTIAEIIVGFLGIPFLIMAVKYLVLLIWSFEQAVIETAAVLKGKKVQLITGAGSFCVNATELLSFSSEFVKEKSGTFPEGKIYLTYEEYLFLLLAVQSKEVQTERTLGVIQENIRYEYDEDFLLSNCIVGFNGRAVALSESGFLNKNIYTFYNDSINGYRFSTETSIRYR